MKRMDAARAYGCERGGDELIIDPSGKIAGFTFFLQPEQLQGVLDGNAVTISRGTEETIRYSGYLRRREGPAGERAQTTLTLQWLRRETRSIAPSYEVHISPSKANGTEGSSGPDFWVQRGFDLKTIVSMVYEKDLSRVVLPQPLANDDTSSIFWSCCLAREDDKTINQLVQRAIGKYFQVSAVVESKPAEVYVMTAVQGARHHLMQKTGPESLGGGFGEFFRFRVFASPGTPQTPEAISAGYAGTIETSGERGNLRDLRRQHNRGSVSTGS